MKKEEFSTELCLIAAFYDRKLNDVQTKIWFDFFGEFTQKEFHDAISKHIGQSDDSRFPAVGTIYKILQKLKPHSYEVIPYISLEEIENESISTTN
jgi:hypothetical protein